MNKKCILTPANRSPEPSVIITKGNDTPITLYLTTGQGEPINLREVSSLSVSIIYARTGERITPLFRVLPEGVLEIEFNAHEQEVGIYGLRVSYEVASDNFADGREQVTWEASSPIEVVPISSHASASSKPINGYIAALKRGLKGEAGDPRELLEELQRRQDETLGELAQRLSSEQSQLTEGQTERLSREQAETLLSEASVRLREQTQALEQQAERLSHEQAQTLSALGEQLGRQQQEQISEQGQSLAEAQQSALRELAEGTKAEYGRATSLIPQQVDAKVTELVPRQVQQSLEQEVSSQLPDVVQGKIVAAVAQELETFVPQHFGIHEDGRMTIDGIPVGASLRGADGKTPYIKDGTWWIGDTDTEVNAEVDKTLFSNAEWLTMANLTAHKAILADKHFRTDGEKTIEEVLRIARGQEDAKVAIAGGRRIGNYATEYFVIDDITKYGTNFILKVRYSKNNGHAVLYWQQGDTWHAVTEKRTDEGFLLTAQLENPTGAVVLMCLNPYDWGFVIQAFDIFSPSKDNIAYPMGTWLGRNKLPHKGDTYLCTNLGVKGERVLLAYDGHNWLTAWGAAVRGETTQEAKQAYAQAILALRSAIINPLE